MYMYKRVYTVPIYVCTYLGIKPKALYFALTVCAKILAKVRYHYHPVIFLSPCPLKELQHLGCRRLALKGNVTSEGVFRVVDLATTGEASGFWKSKDWVRGMSDKTYDENKLMVYNYATYIYIYIKNYIISICPSIWCCAMMICKKAFVAVQVALEELSLALGEVQVPSRVPGVGRCIAVEERNRNSNLLILAFIQRSLVCIFF